MGDPERANLEQQITDAIRAAQLDRAVVLAIEGYGPEIVRYLHTLLRDPIAADDAFALFCESVWRGLPRFRGDATVRVWCYALARHARTEAVRQDRKRGAGVALGDVPSVELAAARVRTATAEYLRTDARTRIDRLRDQLEPDDQMLLVLRLARQFEWKAIARALADPDAALDDAELAKRAAVLRKRYQRVKDDLRAAAQAAVRSGGDDV